MGRKKGEGIMTKVFCNECKHFKVPSMAHKRRREEGQCRHPSLYIGTRKYKDTWYAPGKTYTAWHHRHKAPFIINENNDCINFEQKPPKMRSFRIFKW